MSWLMSYVASTFYNADKNGWKTSKKKATNTNGEQQQDDGLPKGVRFNPASKKIEYKIINEDGSISWKQVNSSTDYGSKIPELLIEEREFLKTTKNYIVAKGEMIKVLWAEGRTPKEISSILIKAGEKGVGYETVRNYTELFNKNHLLLSQYAPDEEE